eukprot:TRINITY_DN3191_c0_g1_i1.p1 TRINITY_DN3191_c0_g1~~TRINITY_DN3191_c0_g1_i1.p1  ORF type:complete len:413 (+),score=38.08 TRINITY_DN3191_c0_g1_i1:271-1509(+)
MALTFSQNKENIKNHMVQFLMKEGIVSKTYFGLELGTVCRTPTRGRTKLLMEAYPDVFLVKDDTITLRNYPAPNPQEEPVQQEGRNPPKSFPNSPSPLTPMNGSDPQTASVDSGSVSRQQTWENEQWHAQYAQYVPYMYTPGTSPGYALSHDGTYYPHNSYYSQPQLHPHQQPHYVYQQQTVYHSSQEYGYPTPIDNRSEANDYQAEGVEVREGELAEYRPPSEVTAMEILDRNNGAMEVSELMGYLGIHQSDPLGEAKVYHLLSNSSSMTVKDGVAFVKEVPVRDDHSQSATKADSQSRGNNKGQQNQRSGSKSDNLNERPEVPAEGDANNEEGSGDEPPHRGGNQDSRDDDIPVVGAKTIRIGSIHVDNINIQTVNLHVHVDDMKKTQVSDLVQLQAKIQDLFEAVQVRK